MIAGNSNPLGSIRAQRADARWRGFVLREGSRKIRLFLQLGPVLDPILGLERANNADH
jgi:hypothetical protein